MTRRQYVAAVLQCYTSLPDTPQHGRKPDRLLALKLFDEGIPILIVRTALLLATARRAFRSPEATPLEPVRSLYYFVPVIREVQRHPPDPVYLALITERLRSGFPDLGVPPVKLARER